MNFTADILGIDPETHRISVGKANGGRWGYKYAEWEIPPHIEDLLAERQNKGWNPIAMAKMKRIKDGEALLTMEDLFL